MRLLSVLVVPALLGSCGGGAVPPDAAGRLERPALAALGEGVLPRERIDRLPVPDGLGNWQLEGREGTTPLGEDGARIVRLAPQEPPAQLSVPGLFDARALDLLRVRGTFPGEFRVTLQLSGQGVEPFRPPTLGTRNESGPQTLSFDLARLRGRSVSFDRLTLHVEGPPQPVELRAIELVDAPEGLFLAAPGAPPEVFDLDDGIGRSANGLTVALPVGCRFRVDHAGDRLSFALALAPRIRPAGGEPRVRVTVGPPGEDGERHTVPLEGDRGIPSAWQEIELPLGRWEGKEVEARWEYLCEAEQPGVVALAEVQVWRPRLDPPLVLLVSSDTHRADHLRASGLGVDVDTPALDALAAEGLLFERCWTTTNVTSPSHVAMLTGVHPRDTRLVSNVDRLSPHAFTLCEAFRDAGWATIAAVSVRHLGPRGTHVGQGFDRILAPTAAPWDAEVPVERLMEWIEQADGKPVFAFLHLFDAHHPYEPPGEYDRRYYPPDRDPMDPALPPLEARRGSIPKDFLESGLRDLEFPRAQYRGEIAYLDGQLGRVLALERVRRGLVAVTADHGEILVKDGTYFNHGELYPDTLHVPLLLGGAVLPDELRGGRVAARVPQLDLPRTLLDLAGLAALDFPGRNLLATTELAPAEAPPLFALAAHGASASVAEGDWFLLLHLRDHQGTLARARHQHELELFDLASDPECLTNVADAQAEQAERLRGILVEWLADTSETGLSTRRVTSAAELEQLQELGYATDAAVIEDQAWYEPEK